MYGLTKTLKGLENNLVLHCGERHHKSQNPRLVCDSLPSGRRQFSSHMARKSPWFRQTAKTNCCRMPSAHEFLRLCPRSKMTMFRMCTWPTRHFRLDAKTRDPAISHRRATVQTYHIHGSMSQQSARLDAESALNKRQPGVSSSNGGQCYAQYLVVYGPKGLPRITVMRILLAMLMTPAIACEPPSFPTSGSPETHLTSPSRNLVHGQRFAFSKHQSKKCGRDVQTAAPADAFGKEPMAPLTSRANS